MVDRWLWWSQTSLETEYRQLVEEGRDTECVEAEFDRLLACDEPGTIAFQEDVNALLDETILLPVKPDYPYVEPSGLDGIRAQRPAGPRVLGIDLPEAARKDRISGAWLGRCAGCLLGKPIEGVHSDALWALLEQAGLQEIADYVWQLPGLSDGDYRELGFARLLDWRHIDHMPEDDDTNYTVTGLALVKAKGTGFSPQDVAGFWLANIPIHRTFTAERVAYRNLVNQIEPPRSASVRNPYREWIGAQIRADFFGYVALGRPELAAELAWRDACVSHVKNGIYGEMWVAAMLAAAAIESDMRRVIQIGLSEIPERSRLAQAVADVLRWHATGTTYHEAVQEIHHRWDESLSHHWCHTLSNAQIVTLGLLYGGGDFEKSIARAVYPCFDTDCNGATVGSIVGMMLGEQALPSKWTGVMNDTIHTSLSGYQVSQISRLGEEMYLQHMAATSRNGGRR